MNTNVSSLASHKVNEGAYTILVSTGQPGLDKIIYEIAYLEIGQLIDINEKEDLIGQSGKLEITFTSTPESAFIGSGTTVGSAYASTNGWYYGNGYWGGTGYASGTSTTIASGSAFTWQNSTMLMTLRDKEGNRLWTADYQYKGGWEMSGWVVNTPDEAGRLCVKRLKKRMEADLFM